MQYRQLGDTDLQVSRLCLGTMTWGGQNNAADAAEQLDIALDHGVNFIDTAELYAVPIKEETQGVTERYIGEWLAQSGRRDEVIIATKMSGPGVSYIREARGLEPKDVASAIDGSLKRLQTDVIDLYQLHWPQRQTNTFSRREFDPINDMNSRGENIEKMLEALGEQIKAGKIRHIGLSNETAWGIMRYMELHRSKALPRVQSCQNPYSLLQRNWDVGASEVAMREKVGLLAYSPLGGGILTGKYLDGNRPVGARYTDEWGKVSMSKHASNADSDHVRQYVNLARENDMTPTQLAMAYVNSRPYLTSNIFGATTREQLEECLSSDAIELSPEILQEINRLHDAAPSPSLSL